MYLPAGGVDVVTPHPLPPFLPGVQAVCSDLQLEMVWDGVVGED